MKKVCLISIIVIGILVCSTTNISGCKHHRHYHDFKKDKDVSDRIKHGSFVVVSYNNNDAKIDNNENTREKTSEEVQRFMDQNLRSINQIPQRSVRSRDTNHDNILQDNHYIIQNNGFSNKEEKYNLNPYIRIKSVHDAKGTIKRLANSHQAHKHNKIKNNPIAIIISRQINKRRRRREKNYMCYCKESDCHGSQCIQNVPQQDYYWKRNNYLSAKENTEDVYTDDTSEKKMHDPSFDTYNFRKNYAENVATIPMVTNEPTKFNIPFANNVNFDQRVLIDNRNQMMQVQNQQSFPFYKNAQLKKKLKQPYSRCNSHTTPNIKIPHSRGTPFDQNYDTATRRFKAGNKNYIPSIFDKNFLHLDECFKLFGRTDCLISSSTKPSVNKIETTDLSDDISINDHLKQREKNVDSYNSVAISMKPYITEGKNQNLLEYPYHHSTGRVTMPISAKKFSPNNNAHECYNHFEQAKMPLDSNPKFNSEKTINCDNHNYFLQSKANENQWTEQQLHSNAYKPNYPSINNEKREGGDRGINYPYYTSETTNLGNLKLITEKPEEMSEYYNNDGSQQTKVMEFHSFADNNHIPNYSLEQIIQNKKFKENVAKISPTYLNDNDHVGQETIRAVISETPVNNADESQFISNNLNQNVKYYNNDEPNYTLKEINENYDNNNDINSQSIYYNLADQTNLQSKIQADRATTLVSYHEPEQAIYYQDENIHDTNPIISNDYIQVNPSYMYSTNDDVHSNIENLQEIEYYKHNDQNLEPVYVSNYENVPSNLQLSEKNVKIPIYYTATPIKVTNQMQVERQENNNKDNQEIMIGFNQQGNDYSMMYNTDNREQLKPTYNLENNGPHLNLLNEYKDSDSGIYVSIQNPQKSLQSYNLQSNLIMQSPEFYKTETPNTNEAHAENINFLEQSKGKIQNNNEMSNSKISENDAQSITTLEDVENDNYRSLYTIEKMPIVRATDNLNQEQVNFQTLSNENVNKIYNNNKHVSNSQLKTKHVTNTISTKTFKKISSKNDVSKKENSLKYSDTEALFKGTEKIILENDDIMGSVETDDTKSKKVNITKQIDLNKRVNTPHDSFRGVHINSELHKKLLNNNQETKTTLSKQDVSTIKLDKKKYIGTIDQNKYKNTQEANENTNKNNFAKLPANMSPDNVLQKTQTTENLVQSVDERPLFVHEDTSKNKFSSFSQNNYYNLNYSELKKYNEIICQNAIKKVINNFVPGKAQDLTANYENKNMQEIVGANKEELLPEILNISVLKNLFSLPEVENMITDMAGNFFNQITDFHTRDVSSLIKSSFHSIIEQIPHPQQTITPITVEENRYKNGQWVTERETLLRKSPNVAGAKSTPKEVFDKIKSIISKTGLQAETVAQPVIQNLLIKTVKHSLDKEKGIIDESTIRRAFKLLIQPVYSTTPNSRKLTTITKRVPKIEEKTMSILQPKITTVIYDNDDYKRVPTTQYALHGGQWIESQKNLVEKSQNKNLHFDKDKKVKMQDSFHNQQFNKKIQENTNIYNTKLIQNYNSNVANIKKDENLKTIIAKPSDYRFLDEEKNNKAEEHTDSIERNYDAFIEQKSIKYYSPNDRVLDYIKNHQNTEIPSLTTMEKNNEGSNEQTVITNKYRNNESTYSNSATKSILNNQLNLLVNPSRNSQQTEILKNNKQSDNQLNLSQTLHLSENMVTKSIPQYDNNGNLATSQKYPYLGKLVPIDYRKTPQAKNLADLQDSDLVYVGDGVKLPLTIRKLKDGTFALTLSDEVCKQFVDKECPCCLPNNNKGIIVRETKTSGEVTSDINFTDDEVMTTNQKYKNLNPIMQRIRRTSSEVDERIPIENKSEEDMSTSNFFIKKLNIMTNDKPKTKTEINNELKNDLQNRQNYQISGPPYRYQRYADEDLTVNSRKKVIKNMLHLMKDFIINIPRKNYTEKLRPAS